MCSRCEHDFSWPRLIRSILKIDFPLLSTLFHSLLDKKYRAIVLENFSLPIQLSIYSREIIGIYFHSTANYQTDFLFFFCTNYNESTIGFDGEINSLWKRVVIRKIVIRTYMLEWLSVNVIIST